MERHYVCFIGRKPGIYRDWHHCHNSVTNFSGSLYKRYNNYEDALEAWNDFVKFGNGQFDIYIYNDVRQPSPKDEAVEDERSATTGDVFRNLTKLQAFSLGFMLCALVSRN